MRFLFTTALLALTYLVVVGHWSMADVLVALAAGAFVTLLFGRFHTESAPRTGMRTLAIPWFFVGVAIELCQGSWTMLLVLTGIKTWKKVGFVEVPYGERTPRGALITALVATASPGSVLVEMNDERGVMVFSAIDATDPDAVRAGLDRFYHRFQKPVIP